MLIKGSSRNIEHRLCLKIKHKSYGVIVMKILYVTTVSSTINAFFKAHIEMLVDEGHTVELASNKDLPIDDFFITLGCKYHRISFSRSPLSSDNIKAYKQLKNVIKKGGYDIVHCHTPNASVITRLVCRKYRKTSGLRVFYTAHGFHFYKGAPKLNWLVYYPIEKICSRFTDKLITINKEDFNLAKNKFKAKSVHYVPGVGIDLSRFENVQVDRNAKRQEIGVPEDAVLITSVGELSQRKNHRIVLQALAEVENKNVHYAIVGSGVLLSYLQSLSKENNISHRIHFLDHRKDVAEIYSVSDICCLPSVQEGLPVALIEAMACGLPAVCSRIRGCTDLINEESGFLVDSYNVDGFAQAISKLIEDKDLCIRMGTINQERVQKYSIDIIVETMKNVYES